MGLVPAAHRLPLLVAVYIDAGMGVTNPVTLTFVTSGPSFARNWKVKICQIPCSSTYRGERAAEQLAA